MSNNLSYSFLLSHRPTKVGLNDNIVRLSVCLSVCLSVADSSYMRLVRKYQINQRENLLQCWDHESRLPDDVITNPRWQHISVKNDPITTKFGTLYGLSFALSLPVETKAPSA